MRNRLKYRYTRASDAGEGLRIPVASHLIDGSRPSVLSYIVGLQEQQVLADLNLASLLGGATREEAQEQVARSERLQTLVPG